MSILGFSLTILLNGGVIKEDFLINRDLPYTCSKSGGHAFALKDGWYVVWGDTRNAIGTRWDIYGQALTTDLEPVGPNTVVPSDPSHFGSIAATASDSAGNAIILWMQSSEDGMEYWLRRVSPSGELLREDTLLFTGAAVQKTLSLHASLAMNAKGEYVIAWPEQSFIGVIAFNADGSQKWPGKVVVEDATCIQPQVAMADNGSVIVAWSGDWTIQPPLPERAKVFARCYKPDGEPRSDVIEVANFASDDPIKHPTAGNVAVDCDHAGIFIVSWILQDSYSSVRYALYSRRFDWDGSTHEPAQKIYDIPANEAGSFIQGPKLVVGWDGSFTVAWSDDRTGQYRTYLQNFFADGTLRSSEMTLSEPRSEDCIITSLVRREDQWFAAYKTDQRWKILGRRGNVYGGLMDSEVLINDDLSSGSQTTPQVLADDSGNFVTLWTEDVDYDIQVAYGRRFSKTGEPISDTFRIVDSLGKNPLRFDTPASMDRRSGEFVLSWERANPQEIIAQRYNKYGQKKGGEIHVANYTGDVSTTSISMNRKGSFAVAWINSPPKQLYVKRFDKNNVEVDTGIIVVGTPDEMSPIIAVKPAIALKDDGSFIVVWKDGRDAISGGKIYAQRFNIQGKPWAAEFMVFDSVQSCTDPIVAADKDGNFCISWLNQEELAANFVKFYDRYGNELTDTIRTGIYNPNGILRNQSGSGVCALPNGSFVFFGTDCADPLTPTDVSAVYYKPDGAPYSEKITMNQPDFFINNYQMSYHNSVAAGGDRIIFVWQDNRRHLGWDVYGKILDLEMPGIEEPPSPSPLPLSFDVISTVGPTFTLRYSDWPQGFRALVFDASGRRVDEIKTASSSGTIAWGKDYGPGVYFILPCDGKLSVHKTVLVK